MNLNNNYSLGLTESLPLGGGKQKKTHTHIHKAFFFHLIESFHPSVLSAEL
jgi:hypothetical protein